MIAKMSASCRAWNLSLFLWTAVATGAQAFDTGHHFDLTRAVLAEHGFSDDAILCTQVANWLTDAVAIFPGNDDEAARLHYDSLFGAADVRGYSEQFLRNLDAVAADAANRDDSVRMLAVLGAALHVTQDFYSHSTWVEQSQIGSYRQSGHFSAATYNTLADQDSHLVTGFYPPTRSQLPVEPPTGAREHGPYEDRPGKNAINRDSHVRPGWAEAYVCAYCASHELLDWLQKRIEARRPSFWTRLRRFALSDGARSGVEADRRAAIGLSMWVRSGPEDGHWKGNRSGQRALFALRGLAWSTGPASIVHREFQVAAPVQELLATGLYPPPRLKETTHLDQMRRQAFRRSRIAIMVRTIEVEAGEAFVDGSEEDRHFPDLYPLIRIAGVEYHDRVIRRSRKCDRPWWTIHFVDGASADIPIEFELRDEDSVDSSGDEVCDIHPDANHRGLKLKYELSSGRISGDAAGQEHRPLNVRGDESQSATITFVVEQAKLQVAP